MMINPTARRPKTGEHSPDTLGQRAQKADAPVSGTRKETTALGADAVGPILECSGYFWGNEIWVCPRCDANDPGECELDKLD